VYIADYKLFYLHILLIIVRSCIWQLFLSNEYDDDDDDDDELKPSWLLEVD